jgi:hypothetical protein
VKSKLNLVVTLLIGLAMNPSAYAADAQDADDATITVVGENETPDDVVKVIELPAHASANASGTPAGKSASGTATASTAKEKSNEAGHDSGKQGSEDAHNNNGGQVRDDAKHEAHDDARNDNAKDKDHGKKSN